MFEKKRRAILFVTSVASHIWALIASMSKEEKKTLEEEGEKYGLGF
jgi:hypothetical protein